MELPSLRYVTQAGGRLAPDKVRRFAEHGRRRGWELFVMYGQTEATARMAYRPPRQAASKPGAIGIPVPGGSFRIDPVPGLEEGERTHLTRTVRCPRDDCRPRAGQRQEDLRRHPRTDRRYGR